MLSDENKVPSATCPIPCTSHTLFATTINDDNFSSFSSFPSSEENMEMTDLKQKENEKGVKKKIVKWEETLMVKYKNNEKPETQIFKT